MGIISKTVSSIEIPASNWHKSARSAVARFVKNCGLRDTGNGRRGMWVVFLGPDGAGKTSVIVAIGDGAAAGFSGCEAFHLRPRLIGGRSPSRSNPDPQGEPARCAIVTL